MAATEPFLPPTGWLSAAAALEPLPPPSPPTSPPPDVPRAALDLWLPRRQPALLAAQRQDGPVSSSNEQRQQDDARRLQGREQREQEPASPETPLAMRVSTELSFQDHRTYSALAQRFAGAPNAGNAATLCRTYPIFRRLHTTVAAERAAFAAAAHALALARAAAPPHLFPAAHAALGALAAVRRDRQRMAAGARLRRTVTLAPPRSDGASGASLRRAEAASEPWRQARRLRRTLEGAIAVRLASAEWQAWIALPRRPLRYAALAAALQQAVDAQEQGEHTAGQDGGVMARVAGGVVESPQRIRAAEAELDEEVEEEEEEEDAPLHLVEGTSAASVGPATPPLSPPAADVGPATPPSSPPASPSRSAETPNAQRRAPSPSLAHAASPEHPASASPPTSPAATNASMEPPPPLPTPAPGTSEVWDDAGVRAALRQAPPQVTRRAAADAAALKAIAAALLPGHAATWSLPARVEGSSGEGAERTLLLGAPFLPSTLDVRAAHATLAHPLLRDTLTAGAPVRSRPGCVGEARAWWLAPPAVGGGEAASDGARDGTAGVYLVSRHFLDETAVDVPGLGSALLAPKIECLGDVGVEAVSQSFGAEWAISLALEPEANHLVTGAVDAATGELMAAQIVSGQGLESALEDGGIPLAALWESVLLLLVSLLRDMEPGSYVLQHRPGASHVDVLVPAPPTERRPPPQSPALVSAPPMPLVHHLPSLTEQVPFTFRPKPDDVVEGSEADAHMADPVAAAVAASDEVLNDKSDFRFCYDLTNHKQCARGLLCPYPHIALPVVRRVTAHLAHRGEAGTSEEHDGPPPKGAKRSGEGGRGGHRGGNGRGGKGGKGRGRRGGRGRGGSGRGRGSRGGNRGSA